MTGLADPLTILDVSGRPQQPSELVGRDQDLAVIGAFVDELPARGGALVLSGEPGVGKSALLDAAEEQAARAGIRSLRAAGARSEDISFSGLNQLLLPLCGDFDRLDRPQRTALSAALGFSDGPPGGRLVVSNAALTLLGQAAVDRPLMLAVDNLQWMDQASTQVLGFVARRLRQSWVGLIAAERTGTSRPSALDVPGYEVRPLDDDASARLVTARFPGLAPAVRRRIVAEARGNPLALLQLPVGLSSMQRSALAPLPAVLPLSGRLQEVLPARVSALPPAAGHLLLLAVLDGTGDLGLLRAAAGQCEITDLAPAEEAGLVRVDETTQRVIFLHPGIPSAVLGLSASGAVRRAHLALAEQLHGQPERRAWHLAGAANEPNGEAAGPLARVPTKPRDTGDAERERRIATAAYLAASVTGDLGAAEALLADARCACPGSEPSAETALATAFVLLHGDGDAATAHRLLLRGIETVRDGVAGPLGPEQSLLLFVTLCQLSGRAEHWEALERLVAGAGSAVTASVGAAVRGVPASGTAPGLAGETEPAQIVRIATAFAFADRLGDCRQALRRVARLEPHGTPAMQATILLAFAAYQTGEWDEAWRLAETAADLCASRGYELLRRQAQTVLALVAACRGDAETAAALADEIARWAAPRGLRSLLAGAHYACVLTALGQSDFATAYQRATGIGPAEYSAGREPVATWALLDLVEAALRTDRRDDAEAQVQAARRALAQAPGQAATSPRMALLASAAMAMTAPDDEAPALFDLALASEEAERWPFELARVRLLYGERLRRVRATGTARVQLGAALAEFRRLGASTWADRAATALRATGQVPPGQDNRVHQLLTPHELQIARLAAVGLSNRQIADRLFMSHRTVASHLYRMFPKLGITSRAALGTVLPPDSD